METTSILAHLQQIRDTLLDAIRTANSLERMLVGPHPDESERVELGIESLDRLLAQINTLSIHLVQVLAHIRMSALARYGEASWYKAAI